MASPIWQPSTQYPTGSIVQRASAPSSVAVAIPNAGFESGAVSWDFAGNIAIDATFAYQGTQSLRVNGTGTTYPQITTALAVTAGTSITASCMYHQGGASASVNKGRACLIWYTSGLVEISKSFATTYITSSDGGWKKSIVTGIAPATAAFVKIAGDSVKADGGFRHNFDNFVWNLTVALATTGLEYKAVQSGLGTSAGTEPTWPVVLGNTVVDGTVTWQAVTLSSVTWTASPDLVSSGSEPTWITGVGNYTLDGAMQWVAISRIVDDPKCPQKTVVSIGASKVFVGDDDIMRFSATVNPLDWSTERDAGYLPTGLQQAGANKITVSGLYRNNLVVFNANCFQMWQIDPDPESMALLDQMQGIGSLYQQAAQEVADELFFLSAQGVRTIGLSASSESLQSGDVGSPIDSMVVPSVNSAVAAGLVPRATYYTGMGQYWLTGDGTAPSSIDPYASYVLSLSHMNGTAGSPTLTDEVSGNVVWTNYNPSTLTLSSTRSKTGGTSFYKTSGYRLNGVMQNALTTSQNWCYEMWVNFSSITGSSKFTTPPSGFDVQITTGGILRLVDYFSTVLLTCTNTPIVVGTGYDICVEKTGGVSEIVTVYLNGVNVGSTALVGYTSWTAGSQIHLVGGTNNGDFDHSCYYDEFRFTSYARYNGNYTPSAGAFPNPVPSVPIYQNVFVYTQNQVGKMGSWSRYVFPFVIDDFATLGNKLYMRGNNGTNDCVYEMDENLIQDDGVNFEGIVQYPWLDFGTAGVTKMMETVDIVGNGVAPTISIGYDQTNPLAVTTPYQLQTDSMTGFPVPIPVSAPTFSIKLAYPSGGWELQQFNVQIRQNWKIR